MRTKLAISATLTAATIGLAGCGGAASGGSAAAPSTSATTHSATTSGATPKASGTSRSTPARQVATITIKNFGYTLMGAVRPGEQVAVTNHDNVAHTVTADQSDSLFNVTVPPGKTVSFTAPSKPGSYAFHCIYHSNMHGRLVVR